MKTSPNHSIERTATGKPVLPVMRNVEHFETDGSDSKKS